MDGDEEERGDTPLTKAVTEHRSDTWRQISVRIVSHSLKSFRAPWLNQVNPEVKHEEDDVRELGNKSASSGSVSPPGIAGPEKWRCVYGGAGSFTLERRGVDMAALNLRLSFPGDSVAPEDDDEALDLETVLKAAFQGLKICVDYLLGQLGKFSRRS